MGIRRAGAGVVAAVGVGLLLTAATPTARAQVKLEYKYPEGETLTYKTTSKTNQIMTIGGMEITTDVEQTIVTSQVIGQRAGDSLPVRQKIDSLRTEMSLPGGAQITYDSKQPDAKIDNPQLEFLADVFKLVGEMDYTLVLDTMNKVKAVEGAEKLQEKAEKLNPLVKDAMRTRLAADKLKAEYEQSHDNLPGVLARPGEPWERTATIDGGGQEMVVRKKYEYSGTETKGGKTLDKITVKTLELKFKDNPNSQAPSKVTKSDLKVDSSDGTILFDREAGRIVESQDKMRVKGTMTLTVGEMELPGELDLSIESTTEFQPKAK
jgi:Family of unknown function (DUF6263)